MKVLRNIRTRQVRLLVKQFSCCLKQPLALTSNYRFFHEHSTTEKANEALPATFYKTEDEFNYNHFYTTMADAKPKIDSNLLSQVATLMNEEKLCPHPLISEDFSEADLTRSVYPVMLSSRTLLSNGHVPFTMTFAGKRYYSSKDAPPETSSESSKGDDEKGDSPPKSKTDQLKRVFAVYGAFGMVFHIVMSLASLGIIYLIVSSGIDVIGLLGKIGIELSSVAAGASTVVIAYAIHKLILPIRATITIVSVPVLVRYLRKAGYLKK